MIDKKGNNEGERAAQEYVDTTLRTSHYKQSEDTNKRVHSTLTHKQFCYALTFMFFVLVITLTGMGKAVRGSYWFEASNEWWLWSDHDMLIAIVEDDPKLLIQNDGWAWNQFQDLATTARLNGFIQVVNDGEHPNLQRWYMQDQLTQSESDPEDGIAGN
jgi:hypothetical protein